MFLYTHRGCSYTIYSLFPIRMLASRSSYEITFKENRTMKNVKKIVAKTTELYKLITTRPDEAIRVGGK